MNVVISKDADELASRAGADVATLANEAIRETGLFTVALSGGSTPLLLYKTLLDAAVDWERVFFYFGDERNVAADEDASNFKGANKSLFRPLRIREDNILRWRTELGSPLEVADDYEETLQKLSADLPKFDLILLGMGADGHTASLFPGTDALNERQRLAVANWVPQLGSWRFTLTYPVINNARNVMFLVAGKDKAEIVREVLEGDEDLPAKLVQPTTGKLAWYLDRASARDLEHANI
ncbi:MAG: 6-phosphogluconolactonase [bacterium]|nr:6-phosphogluconolactonase [bacterium]